MTESKALLSDATVKKFNLDQTDESKMIYYSKENKTLEFYPRGFTKPTESGCSRQEFYEWLFELAKANGKEKEEFPIGRIGHRIIFTHQKDNKFDTNAIHISYLGKQWESYQAHSMGFVPRELNREILMNMSLITSAIIKSVSDNVNGKFYGAKIIIGFDGNDLATVDIPREWKRFAKL